MENNSVQHRLLFLANAGPQDGIGHVMRCLSLALECQSRGHDIAFACARLPAALKTQLTNLGISVTFLADENDAIMVTNLLTSLSADICVIDGYTFDQGLRQAIAEQSRCLSFDDLGDERTFNSDILVNPWPYANTLAFPLDSGTEFLLGGQFFPFRPEVREAALSGSPERGAETANDRLLLTLGGSDPEGFSFDILDKLLSDPFNAWQIDLIVGPAFQNKAALQHLAGMAIDHVVLHENVTNMVPLMQNARMALSAGGTTSAELAVLGIPMVLAQIVDNQRLNASHAWCPVFDIRKSGQINALYDHLCTLWSDAGAQKEIADRGLRLFHSNGVERIADRLLT